MKQEIRSKLKIIRDTLPLSFREKADSLIANNLSKLISKSDKVAIYAPINSEVNLLSHLEIIKANFYLLPVVRGDTLEFHAWSPSESLDKGKFCLEPKYSSPLIPDVIITPCLGFDKNNHRLGYGKGFYDRTLTSSIYKKALKIGVAYSQQELDELSNEPHDIALDLIVTEQPRAYPIRKIIQSAQLELESLGISTARLDAELLLAHSLGMDRNELFLRSDEAVCDLKFKALLHRRKQFEPIAYILGYKEFWELNFKVTKDTLIPRPDSELIIEMVKSYFPNTSLPYKILDLGTGTGCLGISLAYEYKNATATLVDISSQALDAAKYNAKSLGMEDRISTLQSSWFKNLNLQQFDIIICNPPYIARNEMLMPDVLEHEPHQALFADDDGYSEYIAIADSLHDYMSPKSLAFLEFGQGQGEEISKIFQNKGYGVIAIKADLAGIDRVIIINC
ncbi:MAG: prmC [Candidatus Midichloriaceae bacterium]|jgi:release factor glutamine methyltransferase|nr:prmC [Candidatus Midichloriaceae bacterium]